MKSALTITESVYKIILIWGFMLISWIGFASEYPQPLQPPQCINDYTNQLDKAKLAITENRLIAFYDSTGTEVAVVIENSTQGREIAEYAIGLFNEWGVGDKKREDGVLLYIALEDRKLFIVTGRGVEDKLPDIYANRIVKEDIKPYFKEGNYEDGIQSGVAKICGYVKGEIKRPQTPTGSPMSKILIIIFIILFFTLILPFIS